MTPWTVASQAPLSMGFTRQEYWVGLPCLSPGDFPNPSIEPGTPALQSGHHLGHQESHDKPRHHIKKQGHHFANKGPYVKAVVRIVEALMRMKEENERAGLKLNIREN